MQEQLTESDVKKIQEYNKAFNSINQMANNIIRTGKMLTPYEMLEVDEQLANEEIQKEKLEIEKLKQGTEEDKKVEIKIIGVD